MTQDSHVINTPRAPLAPAALAITLLAGCSTTMNERPWIGQTENNARGGAVYLDLVRAEERPEAPLTSDGPSVVSLTRENWRPMVFTVPVDGVASRRNYTTELHFTDTTARQRGEHPTALSALELSGPTRTEQALEGLVNPFNAFGDAVLMPARMAVHWPWREVYSFPPSYWRAPEYVLRRPLTADCALSQEHEVPPPAQAPAERPVERPEAPAGGVPERPETPAS
ncbi:MAG TPA: hypothetical protein VD997_03660 [Phycisphaerales bacterium]|nr:hypothetical protein [Phycisphaerales bacterium]